MPAASVASSSIPPLLRLRRASLARAAYAAFEGRIVAPDFAGGARTGAQRHPLPDHCPGIMETPMLPGMPAEVQDALNKMVPFPTRIKPAEYAALVRHIAENAYLNGEVIRLMAPSAMGAK